MRAVAILFCALLLGVPDAGFAQPAADVERAAELYEEALDEFRSGEPARAAELFRQSYDLVPKAELLYNEAFAWARAGDLDAARRVAQNALRGELPADVEAKFRARLIGWRSADRATVVATTPAPAVAEVWEERPAQTMVDQPTPTKSGPGGGRITSYVLGAVGVAGLVTAGVMELRLGTISSELDDASRRNDELVYEQALAEGRRTQTIGQVSLIAGSALLVTAVVLWALTGKKKGEPERALLFRF